MGLTGGWAFGQKHWNVVTGAWEVDGNWLEGTQPANGEQVFINVNGASVTYTVPPNPFAQYPQLQIDSVGTSNATLNMAGSTLNTDLLQVGIVSRGAVVHTAGALNVTGPLGITLGSDVGGIGTYTISGPAIMTATVQAVIGDVSSGTLNVQGGRFIVAGTSGVLTVAGSPGSSGTINLSGPGSVEAGSMQMAPFGGSAVVTQTNGSVTVATDLSFTDPTVPGLGGTVVWNQSGGGVEATTFNMPIGTYNLSGSGLFTTVTEFYGGTSTAAAVFTQTGGTHTSTGTGTNGMNVATLAGTAAVYSLSGGTLNTTSLRLAQAGTGTLNNTGGTHTAGTVTLAPASGQTATYTQSAGSMNVSGDFIVGTTPGGTAVFTMTGGSGTIGSGVNGLVIGTTQGSGTVNLQGGVLTTVNAFVSRTAPGIFNHTGGTHNAGLLTIGEQGSSGGGTYTLSGTGVLTAANINVGSNSAGTFNHNANSVTVSGLLRLGVSNAVSGTYTMAAGTTLSAGTEVIGSNGNGVFTQPAGTTHTVTGSGSNGMTLGELANGSGTMTLSGGVLNNATVRVALLGNGIFNHSAGTHNVSGVLTIGPTGAKIGTYNLNSAGVLNAASIVVGGTGTNGLFSQTGGTSTATNVTVLTTGRYNLTGGSASIVNNLNNSGTTTVSLGSLGVGGGIQPNGTALAGVTTISGGNTVTADYVRQTTLNINTGALMAVRPKGQGGDTSVVRNLVIPVVGGKPTSTFDLADNGLVVEYTGTSVQGTVRANIIAAFNPTAAAHWTAPGITSSVAAADASGSKLIGYGESSSVLGISGTQTASWLGQTVDATAVLARYTLGGDATLDGVVDFNDLVQLAQNYNVVDGNRLWLTGDFTYDGNTDFNDLVLLAQNYNTALPAGGVPAGASASFEADLARALASVPEPAGAALGAVGLGALLSARRRKRRRA
jgi:hypothetical protein